MGNFLVNTIDAKREECVSVFVPSETTATSEGESERMVNERSQSSDGKAKVSKTEMVLQLLPYFQEGIPSF